MIDKGVLTQWTLIILGLCGFWALMIHLMVEAIPK